MTITQHLEFSVLTAPLAAVDRRGLSQAWYSALYGAAQPATTPVRKAPCAQRSAARAASSSLQTERAFRASTSSAGIPKAVQSRNPVVQPGVPERRQPHSALARKIERAFLQRKSPVYKAAFSLDGGNGRVQVLLRSGGPVLKLVAICPPKAARHVAAALAQARYALARRGIALETEISESAC